MLQLDSKQRLMCVLVDTLFSRIMSEMKERQFALRLACIHLSCFISYVTYLYFCILFKRYSKVTFNGASMAITYDTNGNTMFWAWYYYGTFLLVKCASQ